MIAYGFTLGACHSSGVDAKDSYLYCGKLLWPAQREDYLPFPEGMEVNHSSQPGIAQAIEQREKHRIRFAYEDMSISYRVMQEAVDMIIRQGSNHVCLEAGTLEEADSGVPLEVSPLPAADGRVILESTPDRKK
ncbi:hypothetical protein D3879_10060 [Pseudomonas cavernicola]|uniref:Uncharacterized protein n=2 Tax=Pseudomonas cavernicola TaxID=2320866 RepID=A0A418XPP3_9PSED|nr:hypothetical protein D3879_10060 [Pseudomonas cavernicola]